MSLQFTQPFPLSFLAISAGAPPEKFYYDEKDIREHGLGIITAAIFLAGEMAGSGVLALPAAMIGTGRVQPFCSWVKAS